MAEVATMILSPFLEEFFRKLASGEFKDFFKRQKISEQRLEQLETEFLTVNAVIEDAEELLVTKPAVKDWLDRLKDAVYDAEHILDEIATEALQSKLEAGSRSKASKLLKPFSAFGNSFVKEIEPKIKDILGRLKTLIDRKNAIGLKEGVGGRPSDRIETSDVYEPDVFGRNNEKDGMIKMLLSDDTCDNELGVVAIVGMGGLGKTTLAQLVYNDARVKQHFSCRVWVCVSDQFDPFTITKSILETVAGSTSDIKDLEQLQNKLKQELMGKKFLVVLDDVWNQNYVLWENLSKPFKSGVKGSRIIVTTRNDDVASTMRAGSDSIYRLQKLTDEDSWSLFARHAFNDDCSKVNSQLENLGREILKKCDGLPLAIKTIGALLRSKSDKEWNKILKSEVWDFLLEKINIIPALKLSYKYLPSHVKRCFAYCAIFSKDYAFEKDSLILLWMGEGLLHEFGGKTMEEVGDDYFSMLVSRSLFQQSSDNKSSFLMHDLVNDLATFVSGQFIMRLDDNYSDEKLNKVRHLSYGMKYFEGFKKFEFLCKAKKLHTFLPLHLKGYQCNLTNRVVLELLPMLTCLRVLSLSENKNIIELPESIGNFKHLRYLDLSSTKLQKLPDSICGLYNLQVLNLSKCASLVALPREMWKLINLRHLDVIKTCIKDMPMQLGKLKCLKTLTQFVIGKGDGCCIAELGNLPNLRGSLDIVGLQNIKSPIAALDARMRDKKCLNELKLEWEFNGDIDGFESQRDKKGLDKLKLKQNFHVDIDNSRDQMILNNLQPNTNLKGFHVCSYPGKHLSNWLGNPSFSELVSVKLENCKDCESLPALGQLPSLEILSIIGFDGVVSIGREFYCTNSSSVTPFKALKNLSLMQMEKWEEWVLFEAENGVAAFPQLEKLCIRNCPKLIGGLPGHLPSLVELEIEECPQLVASLPMASILHKLVLSKCKVLLEDLPTGLKILTTDGLDAQKFNGLPSTIEILNVKDCEKLEFLPEGMTKSGDSLQELSISQCYSSISLNKDSLPSALKELTIERCNNLEFLPEGMINSHNCLQELTIRNCSALKLLPKGGFPSTLKAITIRGCSKLKTLPEEMKDSCLQQLFISGCAAFESFPKGGLPSTLKTVEIDGCSKLKTLPEETKDNCLQQLYIRRCAAFESFPKGGLLIMLKTVRIRWCENFKFSRNLEFPSLEGLGLDNCNSLKTFPLDLFPKLANLHIVRCNKLESLEVSENCDRDFVITNMFIYNCPNFVSLPKGGLRAPRLASFRLGKCENLRSAPNIFPILRDRCLTSNLQSIDLMYNLVVRWMEWGWGNFPSLRQMCIWGDFEDFESFPEVLLLPSSLTFIRIMSFRNLKSLDKVGLQHLNALKILWINDCPKLKHMPEQGLPISVSLLEIWKCPLLEKQWKSKKGKEWHKIAHVERKQIEGELIE